MCVCACVTYPQSLYLLFLSNSGSDITANSVILYVSVSIYLHGAMVEVGVFPEHGSIGRLEGTCGKVASYSLCFGFCTIYALQSQCSKVQRLSACISIST